MKYICNVCGYIYDDEKEEVKIYQKIGHAQYVEFQNQNSQKCKIHK